jgi:hypothetical protein
MSDSVTILKNIVDANGPPLTRAYVKYLNTIIYTSIADQVLDEVDAKFQATYGICHGKQLPYLVEGPY